jgi:hypothetical protein
VFLLTHKTKGGYSENNGPNVPNMSEHVPDYLPPHGLNQDQVIGANNNTTWADRPLTTSET